MRAGLVAAVLLAASLGCARPQDRTAPITLWAMGREGEVVERLLPGFAAKHPDVRVRVQQIPWSAAHEKLLTAYVGGAMPDVFQAGNTWLPELVVLGATEPLDARITPASREDYFPGILDTNVIYGVTYGVPWYVDTRLLFYRSDLLAAAGAHEPPRTWAAWREVMERLRARGAQHAILLPLREWQAPVILGMQRGAGLLRDGDRYGDFRSAAFREGFAFYLDLFARGLAPRAGETEVGNVYQDFARGWFAVYLTGPWNLGEFASRLPPELKDRWATAPLPSADGAWPGVSLAGGASLALFRGSPRKDAAWQLVEYLSEPAQQAEFYRLTGDLPARRSAWRDPGLAGDVHAQAFFTQLGAVRATPKIPEWERIAAGIAEQAESAVRGERSADEALAALDGEVDALLEKRRWLLARDGNREGR